MLIEIHNRIRKYRKDCGYSQENMANDLEISQAAYTKLENGTTHLTVDRLLEIAKILDRNIQDFFITEKDNVPADESTTVNSQIAELRDENSKFRHDMENRYEKMEQNMAMIIHELIDKKK